MEEIKQKEKEMENEFLQQKLNWSKLDKPKLNHQKRKSTNKFISKYLKSDTISSSNQKNKFDTEDNTIQCIQSKSQFSSDRK